MILIESKRKKIENILEDHPISKIVDVTSKGIEPFIKFSPFYPHGNIPIPYSDNKFAMSVEGIWQGLKVFENSDIDTSKFLITDMKNIKRTVRTNGRVLGHRKGLFSKDLLDYKTARKEIYLRTYAWVLDNILQDLIRQLKEIAFTTDLVLLDFETNIDIDNINKPLSHAGLIKRYLEKKYPEITNMKFNNKEDRNSMNNESNVKLSNDNKKSDQIDLFKTNKSNNT